MRRHAGGVIGLVMLALVEGDGKSLDRSTGMFLQQRDDGRGVDPTREQRAEGDVGLHAQSNGVAQEPVEFIDGLVVISEEWVRQSALRHLLDRPVGRRSPQWRAGVHNGEQMPREQLHHVLIDRRRSRHVQVAQEIGKRARVDRAVERRARDERLELGAERHQSVLGVDEHGFNAEAVANEREAPLARVPHGNAEHADEATRRVGDTPLLERGEDHLGIRMSAECGAQTLQLGAEIAEVEDLAVEHNREAAAARAHRLMTQLRQIDDGEPAEPERHAGGRVAPDARVVGTAMHDGAAHPLSGRHQRVV
jgi:hypothetical protein